MLEVSRRVSGSEGPTHFCPCGSNLRVWVRKNKEFTEVIPLRVIKYITITLEMKYDSH